MSAYRELLRGKLPEKEFALLPRSFDVIGDIAIIELPRELAKRVKIIGAAIMESLHNVKVVAVEQGSHTGKYRRQKLRIIAGEKRLETVHKESGMVLGLEVQKCYFSPRLGSERLRIAGLVKQDEKLLVVGSGVGPYPLIIAKHSKASQVVGVEINPVAHKFAVQNVIKNKLQGRVICIKGDVSKLSEGEFDRIVMAIPHEGVSLVPSILRLLKKGGFLHVLDFTEESDIDAPSRKLVELCKENNRKCKILATIKAGQPGVRRYRVCIDAKVS
ncbi:methyltransferase domain-containing protein [Candidatus Woesearchaeota archaeon]|nr:methyltransferase domain-containing protein [Candidatus Woesearchaeota archaeon]